MKNLRTMLFTMLFVITFMACDEQSNLTLTEPEFVEVSIPDAYKSSTNGRISSEDVDDVILDVQIITTDGKEIVGKIHFVMPDDESLSYFAMTENLLQEIGLSADYWIESFNSSNSNGRIARTQGCFGDCPERGTAGSGTCRAECWLGIAVQIATIVAVIVAL